MRLGTGGEAVRKGLVIFNLKARVRVELTWVVPFPTNQSLLFANIEVARHIKRVVYATHQNAPDYAPQARVIGRGLWRATLRPDIEHKPSEWGRVVVVRPFATNRGRLLAVAKLDGVNDYPNCRSRGGQPLLRG